MGGGAEVTSSNGSGASSAYSTGYDKFLMEGADGTLGAAEDGGDWQKLTQRRRQRGGRKAKARRQGGGETEKRRQGRRRRGTARENGQQRRR